MSEDSSLRVRVLAALNGADVTAPRLAGKLSAPLSEVTAELEALVELGNLRRYTTLNGEIIYSSLPGRKASVATRRDAERTPSVQQRNAPAKQSASRPSAAPRKPVGELLIDAGLITADQLRDALAEQARTGERLGQILIRRGYITKQALGQVLQTQHGLPYIDLSTYPMDEQLIRSVPDWVITQYKVVPIAREGQEIQLAMLDPTDVVAMDTVGQMLGGRVRPVLITERDFDLAVTTYFGLGRKVDARLLEVPPEELAQRESEAVTVADSTDDAPVVRVFSSILDEAIRTGATDVHLEPDADVARVRFRIDGVLYEKTSLPVSVAGALATRLKVLAGLDIAERFRPQDGRIFVERDGREYDLRIATVGTAFGERAAIRLLNARQVLIGLEGLGLFPEQVELCKRLLSRFYGMLLATGPTGSGKTTTLYAATSHINERSRNILTIEDPVEYRLPGITQIPVREKAGVTFEVGLRGILRQDPDVVVVGEIRDPQTASIAVHAALTGHLVLSTLHTSSAAGALIRLMDMGVESFLLTSSVLAVISQRLVRLLCTSCKTPYEASETDLQILGVAAEHHPTLFKAQGCPDCDGIGHKGRTGVFEIMPMTDAVRQAVLQRRPAAVIAETARVEGVRTLRESAMRRVLEGVTSVEEFQRIVLLAEAV